MSRYINPYTDCGFRCLFGEEANKDLLIDFLNAVLPLENKIARNMKRKGQTPTLTPGLTHQKFFDDFRSKLWIDRRTKLNIRYRLLSLHLPQHSQSQTTHYR